MKRLLPLLIFLLICSFAQTSSARMSACIAGGGGVASGGGGGSCTGSNPSTCTFRETFDGSSYCIGSSGDQNCDSTWTSVIAGTPDWNNTSYELSGTNALYLTATSVVEKSLTAANSYTVAMSGYVETRAYTQYLIGMYNTWIAGCLMGMGSGGAITVAVGGGSTSSTIATVANGNRYYFKSKYTIGTGANASCEGWVSTDGTNWGTSQKVENGTGTGQIDSVRFAAEDTTQIYLDDVRVYTGDITW